MTTEGGEGYLTKYPPCVSGTIEMSSPFRKLKIKRTSNLSYLPILLAPTASSAGLSGGVTLSGSQLYTLPPWSTTTLLCFSESEVYKNVSDCVCMCVCM